jgi:hypothetical protein
MTKKEQRRQIAVPYVAILLQLLMVAISPMIARAQGLGDAPAYSVLGIGGVIMGSRAKIGPSGFGGSVAGNSVTLGDFASVPADVTSNSTISFGNYSKIGGTCYAVYAATLSTGAECATVDDFDPGSVGISLFFYITGTQILPFETSVYVNCPTQNLTSLTLAAGKKSTITDTVEGFNLIQIDAITLGNSSTLTVSGGPNDYVVLHVLDALSMGDGARIKLAGGIIPSNLVIFVESDSVWGNSTGLPATILTNGGIRAGSGTWIDGVVLAGGTVAFGSNTTVTSRLPDVNVPTPNQECDEQ